MGLSTYLLIMGFTVLSAILIAIFVTNPKLKRSYIKEATPDISEEEMQQLEDKLALFFKENKLSPTASIFDVARALNVVDGGSVDNIPVRARIYESDLTGNATVVHSKQIPNNERLFDFAHELGHMINNDPLPADRPHGHNKPEQDQLADYTGAALLMPLEQVYDFLIKNNYNSASTHKRISIIKKLSKKYKVNEMITVRRVNEVRLLKNMISK